MRYPVLPIIDDRFRDRGVLEQLTHTSPHLRVTRDSLNQAHDTIVVTELDSWCSLLTVQQVSCQHGRFTLYVTPHAYLTQEFLEKFQAKILDLVTPKGLWTLFREREYVYIKTLHGDIQRIANGISYWNFIVLDRNRTMSNPAPHFQYRRIAATPSPVTTPERAPLTYTYTAPSALEGCASGAVPLNGVFDLEERTFLAQEDV